jgi:hypothetical protein
MLCKQGLVMPCAKCIVMGSTTNLVLTPNYSTACGVMNKLVALESKKQPTNLLFILHFNFNKLESSLSWAPI